MSVTKLKVLSVLAVQGGPAVVVPDGGEQDTVDCLLRSLVVAASEKLSVYGELSAAFDDTNTYGTKAGLKYSF